MKKVTQNINIKACHAIGKLFCVLFLLSFSWGFSQIYISKDACIFTDKDVTISGEIKTQWDEAHIYIMGETAISGVHEYTNADLVNIKSSAVDKKKKVSRIQVEKVQQFTENNLIHKGVPFHENLYSYNPNTENGHRISYCATTNVAVVNTFSSSDKSKVIFLFENYKTDFAFSIFQFSNKKYDNEQKFISFQFLSSFRARPPPHFYS